MRAAGAADPPAAEVAHTGSSIRLVGARGGVRRGRELRTVS